jgi:putative protease
VCSPAESVRWTETRAGREARLNGVLIDVFGPSEPAGYPTLCKGRFKVNGVASHALEEPTSLNTVDILPDLVAAGVRAIKVEGRQRSPTYVGQVTRAMREAIDACARHAGNYHAPAAADATLARVAEGRCHTLGALDREWQ